MDEDDTGATAIDMDAAITSIGEGLGLGEEEMPAVGAQSPAPAPATPAAATPTTPVVPPAPTEKPGGLGTNNPAGSPPVPSPDTPPSTWREGPKAKWAALDPEIRAEVLKREDDFFRGIEGYKADASVGRTLHQTLAPYAETLQQYGIDPMQEVKQLLAAHHQLSTGTPAVRLQAFRQLMQEYKVDPGQLAAEPSYIDPAVQTLQQRIDSIESVQAQERAQQTQQRQAELRTEIEAFAKEPTNVYFQDLANDIAFLLRSDGAKTLREAYDKAIWLNPAVRQKELDRQQTERAKQEETDRKTRLDAAKKAAAAKVRGQGSSSSGTAAAGSMEDTMQETLAAIKAR